MSFGYMADSTYMSNYLPNYNLSFTPSYDLTGGYMNTIMPSSGSLGGNIFMPNFMPDFSMNNMNFGMGNFMNYSLGNTFNPSFMGSTFNPNFLGGTSQFTPSLSSSSSTSTTSTTKAPTSTVNSPKTTPEKSAEDIQPKIPEPEEKEGKKGGVWKKILIGLGITAAVIGLGLGADHRWNNGKVRKTIGEWFKKVGDWFKGLKKSKTEGEKTKVENKKDNLPSTNDNSFISKFKDMSPEQISDYLKSADKNKGEYHEALEQLFAKSQSIEDGEKLIKYYDDIINGKIKFENPKPLTREAILMDSHDDWSSIKFRKADVYADMSHIYKKANNYDKALEMMTNTYTLTEFPSAAAEIAKLQALKGTPNEGLKLAVSELEKVKNNMFNDEQVFLFNGIKECLEKAGNTELAHSIELLKKGSYTFDKLTPEEIKFLTDKGIDYKTICGEGGREQTGAMAKWVYEKVKPLLST